MAWVTPKTDWIVEDGVDFNDFNRIEGNIAFIATNPSGSILQLAPDGGNVGIGIAAATDLLHLFNAGDVALKVETTTAGTDARIKLIASNTGLSQIRFEDEDDFNPGLITYNHTSNSMIFRVNDSDILTIDSSGAATFAGSLQGTPDYGDIGTIVTAASTSWTVSTQYLPGTTVAGNTLVRSTSTDSGGVPLNSHSEALITILTASETSLSLTGTWRLLTRVYRGSSSAGRPIGLLQRIS